MSKMALVVALLAAGACGGKDRTFCEHVNKLCKGEATSKELDECATAMSDAKDDMGDQYDKLVSCGMEADSCMEVIGCGAGAAMNLGEDAIEKMEKGFSKMRR